MKRRILRLALLLAAGLAWTALAAHGDEHESWHPFPSLHPLIVHFPIVLLLLAAPGQLLAIVRRSAELRFVALVLVLLGTIGAWLAGGPFHPHTTGLSAAAKEALRSHDLFATWTLWLATTGTALKIAEWLPALRAVRALQWAALLVITAAAGTVSVTGHHGAVLTHLHGVGPQGKFLEIHVKHKEK